MITKSDQDLEVEEIVEIDIQIRIVEKIGTPKGFLQKKESQIVIQENPNLIYPMMKGKKVLDFQNKLVIKTMIKEEKITKIIMIIIFSKTNTTVL